MRSHEGRRPLALAALLAAMASIPMPAHGGSVAVTDKMGRRVSIPVPARRAVLLEGYEILPVLGAWDRLAGISRYAFDNDLLTAVRPDLRRTVPDAGSAFSGNAEALLRLHPDVVVTWSVYPDTIQFLAEKGLTVVAIYPESLPELYETMRLVGRILGAEPRAEAAIARMEETFALIRRRVAGIPEAERKKALWLLGSPTSVGGGRGVTQDVFALAGLVNGAAGVPQRTVPVSAEKVVVWRPDILFIWGNASYSSHDVLSSPQWRFVPAVKSGRVYKAPKWSTWSPRLAPIALWMAARAYPERFRDVAVDAAIDRFYRDVYAISYAQVRHIED